MFLEVIIHVAGMSFSDVNCKPNFARIGRNFQIWNDKKWDIREESILIPWAYFFFLYEEGLSRKRPDKG